MIRPSTMAMLVCWLLLAGMLSAAWGSPSARAGSPAAPGSTVRLCVSVPGTELAELSVGVYHAVLLAVERFRPQLAGAGIRLTNPILLDYGMNHNAEKEVRNARTCIRRPDTVAYIGPINSAVAMWSEPILNRAGLATISPANTLPGLTDPRLRKTLEPATYARTIPAVTYFRTVPSDAFQGGAAAIFLRHQLGGTTYYLVDDQQSYGVGLASAMSQEARSLQEERVGVAHLRVSPSDVPASGQLSRVADQIVAVAPDAVYCGCDGEPSAYLARALSSRGFHGAVLSGDASHNSQWAKFTGPVYQAFATDPGVDTNRAAEWFRQAFIARFHAATQIFDAYAYDAAAAALRAVYSAAVHGRFTGSIAQRRRVVVSYVARTCFRGATGPVSFDRNGDTTNRSVSVYADELGSWHLRTVVAMGHTPHCG